jgi:hypothetical protein
MSEMTVGCIRTTVIPQQSGIYEALLDRANRDAAELADRLSGLELSTVKQLAELERERDKAREDWYEMHSSFERSRDEVEKLIRERDEARAQRDAWEKVALREASKMGDTLLGGAE